MNIERKDFNKNINSSNVSSNSIVNPTNFMIKNHDSNLNNDNAHKYSFKKKSGDSFKETIYKMEDNEKLLRDQVYSF